MERDPKKKPKQTREEAKADRVDYPHRHPSLVKNQQADEISFEEVQEWFELEGKTDNIHLGS